MAKSNNKRKDGSDHTGHKRVVRAIAKLGAPFVGLMVCVLCKLRIYGQADKFAGGWRAVQNEQVRLYACAQCTPQHEAGADEWKEFYVKLGGLLFAANACKPLDSLIILLERDGLPPLNLGQEALGGETEQADAKLAQGTMVNMISKQE